MNHAECNTQLVDWALQGSAAPLAQPLRDHLPNCEACTAYVESIKSARTLGALLPTTTMPPSRHDSMKLQLMAEARRHTNCTPKFRPETRRYTARSIAVALSVVTAAAAMVAVSQRKPVPLTPTRQAALPTRTVPIASLAILPPAMASTNTVGTPTVERTIVTTAPKPDVVAHKDIAKPSASNPAPDSDSNAASDGDEQFTNAWAALRANRPKQAATQFDALLARATLDPARRADILYWSAQAHRQAGNATSAQARSTQLLRDYPQSQFASHAALLLGEAALSSHQLEQAERYLSQAKTSRHPLVRERAARALETLKSYHP